MLIALFVFVIGAFIIKKLWPYGLIFVIAVSAIGVAIKLPILQENYARFGQEFEVTPNVVIQLFGSSFVINSIVFLVGFGISKFIRSRH